VENKDTAVVCCREPSSQEGRRRSLTRHSAIADKMRAADAFSDTNAHSMHVLKNTFIASSRNRHVGLHIILCVTVVQGHWNWYQMIGRTWFHITVTLVLVITVNWFRFKCITKHGRRQESAVSVGEHFSNNVFFYFILSFISMQADTTRVRWTC